MYNPEMALEFSRKQDLEGIKFCFWPLSNKDPFSNLSFYLPNKHMTK